VAHAAAALGGADRQGDCEYADSRQTLGLGIEIGIVQQCAAAQSRQTLYLLLCRAGIVALHGASAANALGLTQQVPIREVYLTSGRTRKLKLGRSEVLVKHVPRWMLALGAGPAGAAVRALAWMGPAHAGESLATLRRTLPRIEWRALASTRAALPSWLRPSPIFFSGTGSTIEQR
jgi:hypothetical protein